MNANHRQVLSKYWQLFSLATIISLALLLAAGHSLTQAQEPSRMLAIPVGSTSFTYGQGLRTTITNLNNRRVNAQVRVLDAEGTVLKQEPLVLEPNQMRAVTMSRNEVERGDARVLVRAEVIVAQTDAPRLWMTGEVIDWATGHTQFTTTAGRTPAELTGSNINHNETLVRDQQ